MCSTPEKQKPCIFRFLSRFSGSDTGPLGESNITSSYIKVHTTNDKTRFLVSSGQNPPSEGNPKSEMRKPEGQIRTSGLRSDWCRDKKRNFLTWCRTTRATRLPRLPTGAEVGQSGSKWAKNGSKWVEMQKNWAENGPNATSPKGTLMSSEECKRTSFCRVFLDCKCILWGIQNLPLVRGLQGMHDGPGQFSGTAFPGRLQIDGPTMPCPPQSPTRKLFRTRGPFQRLWG